MRADQQRLQRRARLDTPRQPGLPGEQIGRQVGMMLTSQTQLPCQFPAGAAIQRQARLALDCSTGWKLAGQLSLAGQHHADLAADLLARQARLTGRVEPGAALQPLLVSAQWLAPGGTQVARTIRW